jgi:hypothetical protein
MRTKHVMAAALIAVGAATTFAAPAFADPADPNAAQRDEMFTKAVRDEGFRISPKEAIDLGHSTCELLKRTGSVQDALYHVKNATDWTNVNDISKFGGLAVQAYCPTAMPKG